MSLEALSSNEFLNFIIYDTLSAPPYSSSVEATLLLENIAKPQPLTAALGGCSSAVTPRCCTVEAEDSDADRRQSLAVQRRRKKTRRRPRICKNKAEAETQRMTHIRVERNRRKQMNDHLAVLRSLMPESYVKRGDQASIVGGAIEFVKELEHLLQSLEAQKLLLQGGKAPNIDTDTKCLSSCFEQFFAYPQYSWSQNPNKYSSKTKASVANIEVTLIETHANLRILLRRSLRQLSKIVTGFQALYLTILHLNITTLDPLVLYSISAKVEEGCQLSSADDIAAAVHHMLRIIEEEAEATLC